MQKLPIITILLFSAHLLTAQNWFTKDQQWTHYLTGGFIGVNIYLQQKVDKDTIVAGQPCKKIVREGLPLTFGPRFVYADGNQVFAYNSILESWVKMYDLDLPAGSTVTVQVFQNYSYTYKIESVDMVTVGNASLKRQRAKEVFTDPQVLGAPFDIIQFIGLVGKPFDSLSPQCSSFFLDESPFCQSFVDGFDTRFICFSANFGNLTPYSGCILSSTNTPINNIEVLVTPNPASDYVTVSLGKDNWINNLQVFDIQGHLVFEVNDLNSVFMDLNLQDYPIGQYVFMIKTSQGTVARRIVKL